MACSGSSTSVSTSNVSLAVLVLTEATASFKAAALANTTFAHLTTRM
jgi:hypothetical protein